jgi:UDP-N-acetylmuramoyl-L-alanyl-D-glutamate--2,6-diaminopimelate ligase
MRLSQLAGSLNAAVHGADPDVSGIALDSRQVHPGDLFVALPGRRTTGQAFIHEAVARGALALCATSPHPDLPTLVVPHPRAALPALAAALYDHPAKRLRLIGVTGTLGKTSTALLIQSALEASGQMVGVIGSLGVRVHQHVSDTGMTTPDAPAIHRALRMMVDRGVGLVAMEVTSHAIALGRISGLRFTLGVFTNLVPDEHLEFHPTPEDYLRIKVRFLDMLEDQAPLVVNHDDPRVSEAVGAAVARQPRPVVGVSVAGTPGAAVVLRGLRWDATGSAFALEVTRRLVALDGTVIEPGTVPLVLPVFGLQQVANAALAATAALLAGASARAVTEAVAEVAPIRRRMELVRYAAPAILDDTSGNPRTLRAVFDSIDVVPHDGLRVVFGIRGARGALINRKLGRAMAGLLKDRRRLTPVRLVVTASEDAAGARDKVSLDEREAMTQALDEAGTEFRFEPRLEDAIRYALDGWSAGDLILLLGAQGMNRAAGMARSIVDSASA